MSALTHFLPSGPFRQLPLLASPATISATPSGRPGTHEAPIRLRLSANICPSLSSRCADAVSHLSDSSVSKPKFRAGGLSTRSVWTAYPGYMTSTTEFRGRRQTSHGTKSVGRYGLMRSVELFVALAWVGVNREC